MINDIFHSTNHEERLFFTLSL